MHNPTEAFRKGGNEWLALALLATALCCSTYQLTALDTKTPGVVETIEQRVQLIAKSAPAAPELPPGIPDGMQALWLEVQNHDSVPVSLLVQRMELRIAQHSLAATPAESILLQVPQRKTMSLKYSPAGSEYEATQGLATPSARSSSRNVYASTRAQVLATAFPSGPLAPGQRRQGFVYFAVPDESFSRLELVVLATSSETGATIELRAPFRHGPS